MLKVFIAEDESVVREGLRDSIPWESCGYEFVGDAMDGETALPQILKLVPDLLITDIRMPFMDGLELIRRVRESLPDIKIIILSGYDDFEYARRAIELKVDRYLLKPILKADMVAALNELRAKIDEENERRDYLAGYEADRREYEQFSRVEFFAALISGRLSAAEISRRSRELAIDMEAPCLQTILYMPESGTEYSENLSAVQERVIQKLLARDDVLIFRSGIQSYCLVIKGSENGIDIKTGECLRALEQCHAQSGGGDWHAAEGNVVYSPAELGRSFEQATRLLSYRHFMPKCNIIRQEDIDGALHENSGIDFMNADPMIIRSFIKSGTVQEIPGFVRDYLASTGDSCNSVLFRNYLTVSVRLNAAMVVQEMGLSRESFTASLPPATIDMERERIPEYISTLLTAAIEMRDSAAQSRSGDIVNQSIEYINAHFSDEELSLNSVARAINISANYLSAAFSQKTGVSFVEYITEKRMERAKELLRQTNKRSGEIAAEVGYRDPRYFSFVFKKTQGCSPKEYRNGAAK